MNLRTGIHPVTLCTIYVNLSVGIKFFKLIREWFVEKPESLQITSLYRTHCT